MSAARKLLNWLPSFLWMSFIFYLSAQSGLPGPAWISITGHIVEYGVLAALLYFALSRTTTLGHQKTVILAVILATLYGVTDEWHQSFVPGRVPDPMDLLTDFLAATVVATMTAVFLKKGLNLNGRV